MKWDPYTTNLLSRWDQLHARVEEFEYDAVNRLTGSRVNAVNGQGQVLYQVSQHQYAYDGDIGDTRGNLVLKSDVGQMNYASNKPSGLFNINYPMPPDAPPHVVSLETQTISYTSHHKARSISEMIGSQNHGLSYSYGPDHQRRLSTYQVQGQVTETRTYVGNYEKQVHNGTTRELHYVYGGDGLCAILLTEQGSTRIHFTFTDHLGSIIKVVRQTGTTWNTIAEQNFDPWGRRRRVSTWEYDDEPNVPVWLYRGYTGHEHVEPFRLINMNGRMYDPLNGRMLSADNYVHDGTQGFNRYSYALNNPMKYVDPDGEHPLLVIGIMALAGAWSGGAIAAGDGGLSGANWNPFGGAQGGWGGTDWYNGALIGLGVGATAGWGITALGPVAAGALYAAGLKGAGGLIASGLGYGAVGAIAGGAAGFGTGYLTDRYVNNVPHGEAMNTGWDLAGYGAAIGATVGMTYGLTPVGFERIRPIIHASVNTAKHFGGFPLQYPSHVWPQWPSLVKSVNGFGTNWVNRTLWSTATSVGTSIPGSTALQYALPTIPWWFGQPGFRGPTLWQSGTVAGFNLSFFLPNGGNPVADRRGNFNFPWGGTYVNNNGINIALLFQQRVRFARQGLRFFGLFTIWR